MKHQTPQEIHNLRENKTIFLLKLSIFSVRLFIKNFLMSKDPREKTQK